MYTELENALVGTRQSLAKAANELGFDVNDIEEHNLMVIACSHCSTWHRSHNIIEDLDFNPICRYCETLIGL